VDAVTDLFALLLFLSGLFLTMGLASAAIEQWQGLIAIRPRRAPRRIRQPLRRTRTNRPRRLPSCPGDQTAPARTPLRAAGR
jgi:hypothetical protein